MNTTRLNKKHLILVLLISGLALAACETTLEPERPLNTGDRPRITNGNREEVLPMLSITQNGTESEMKLRSQTSRYLNEKKSILEINLTSSNLAYCQNENPALGEGEEELKITIKSKDGNTPIEAMQFVDDDRFELTANYRSNKKANSEHSTSNSTDMSVTPTNIAFQSADFTNLTITDLSAAIARGELKISTENINIEGEYFTAICQ